MHHFFVEPSQIADGRVIITGADVNHMKNVLRMKPGEKAEISERRRIALSVCVRGIHRGRRESAD